jgi:hypothetical protein
MSGKGLKAVENFNNALSFSHPGEEEKHLRQIIDSLKKLPEK